MKRLLLAAAFLLVSSTALAEAPKTYQVTGPVLDVTDDMVVVEKGKEKWEIAKTAETKVEGELKKGAKVTIQYRMTAATIEVKAEKEKPAKK